MYQHTKEEFVLESIERQGELNKEMNDVLEMLITRVLKLEELIK